jgi:hypothetical protein
MLIFKIVPPTDYWRRVMSALPSKADIDAGQIDVRFVPKADSRTAAKSVYSIASSAVI